MAASDDRTKANGPASSSFLTDNVSNTPSTEEDPDLLPPLTAALTRHPIPVQRLALFHFGRQLERSIATLPKQLRGLFPTADVARIYQTNQYVTSGVTPMGLNNDFDQKYVHMSRQARATIAQLGPGEAILDLDDVLVHQPLPLKDALLQAARLAARIRGDQCLLDGNHRTALLSFVLALAESFVLLRPNFSIYRAYIILSAREHPGNINNWLDNHARNDVASALWQYSRTRVKPGSPDWRYLETQAERIRHLPIYASLVEATYRRLGIRREDYREPEMRDRAEQKETWDGVDARLRADIRVAYPHFHPGAPEKLQSVVQPYPYNISD